MVTKDPDSKIRPAVPGDAPALIKLTRRMLAETEFHIRTAAEYSISEENEVNHIQKYQNDPDALHLVALVDDEPVGFLVFNPRKTRRTAHTGSLGIPILKAWHRRGIAARTMDWFLKWVCDNPRIEHVDLEVFSHNTGALALYERYGFERFGVKEGYIRYDDDRRADIIQMARAVSGESRGS